MPGKGAPGSRIAYYETTEPLSAIPPGPGGYIFRKCPKGSVAVNGYYYKAVPDGEDEGTERDGVFVGFGLDDQGSSPAGYKSGRSTGTTWPRTPEGQSVEIDGVIAGIVCDKDG